MMERKCKETFGLGIQALAVLAADPASLREQDLRVLEALQAMKDTSHC